MSGEKEAGGWRRGSGVRFPAGRWELALTDAMRREKSGGRLEFALPYSPLRPWPLTELVCFAHVESLDGQPYIIYAFDGGKNPVF